MSQLTQMAQSLSPRLTFRRNVWTHEHEPATKTKRNDMDAEEDPCLTLGKQNLPNYYNLEVLNYQLDIKAQAIQKRKI